MTIIDALDKLEHAGYTLGEDSNGIYLGMARDKKAVPLCDPSLSEAIDSLVANKQATIYYHSGMY